MAWTQEKVEATLKSVVEKAQVDPSFREKLKNNPKETLAAEAGEMIPEFIRIAIVDQNDTDIVITLPKVQNDELSDADLEQVAGGKMPTSTEATCNVVFAGLGVASTISGVTGVGLIASGGLVVAAYGALIASTLI